VVRIDGVKWSLGESEAKKLAQQTFTKIVKGSSPNFSRGMTSPIVISAVT
jgi:hypothetical protein